MNLNKFKAIVISSLVVTSLNFSSTYATEETETDFITEKVQSITSTVKDSVSEKINYIKNLQQKAKKIAEKNNTKKEQERQKNQFLEITRNWLEKANLSNRVPDKVLTTIWDTSYPKNIDPYLIFSMINAESTFNPKDYNSCCYGLMQVSKYAVANYNKTHWTNITLTDTFDPYLNIEVGVEDFNDNLDSQDRSEKLALLVYNGGHSYMKRMTRAWIYDTSYTRKVLNLRDKLHPDDE